MLERFYSIFKCNDSYETYRKTKMARNIILNLTALYLIPKTIIELAQSFKRKQQQLIISLHLSLTYSIF